MYSNAWMMKFIQVGRSPNEVVPSGSAEPLGVLSWAPKRSRQVVRYLGTVMTRRVSSQDGTAEGSAVFRILRKTEGVDRIGRSPAGSILRDRPDPSGFSVGLQAECMEVRRHRSVMTNRV